MRTFLRRPAFSAPSGLQADARLTRVISTVAAAISITVALVLPAGYLALSLAGHDREALISARLHATLVSQVIHASGAQWQGDITGLLDADLAPSELPELRIIVDDQGRVLERSGPAVSYPVATASAPLLGRDRVVGEVRISRSLRPVVGRALLLALVSSGLGLAIFVTLRVLPLRALTRLLNKMQAREIQERQDAEKNMELVFETAVEGILICDGDGVLLSSNTAAKKMFGISDSSRKNRRVDELFELEKEHPGETDGHSKDRYSVGLKNGGERFPVEVTINDASLRGVSRQIVIVRDVTERKQAEARLFEMANFDGLTGLPNRSQFLGKLQAAMTRAVQRKTQLALFFMDIDRFKTINDNLGHHIGDQLLIGVGERLTQSLRAGDVVGRDHMKPESGSVFRLGGDEFTFLVEDLPHAKVAARIAKRVLKNIGQPMMLGTHQVFVSASVGIAIFNNPSTDLNTLITQADLAMYRAKAKGRNTWAHFNTELMDDVADRLSIESALRWALKRGEFSLVYQPKVKLLSGELTGVEALLRWNRADGLSFTPDQFIPVLEETGMIFEVGEWVLREACRQLAEWDRAGLPVMSMAINISGRQFREAGLIATLQSIVAEHGLQPGRLHLEITESVLVEDTEEIIQILNQVRGLGIYMAIDDFGTGQSSLTYLKRFELHTLKIDRSFVRDLPANGKDKAIAGAVIALAKGLGLECVAEGVETEAQANYLRAQGCDQMQGYFLARPMAPEQLRQWVEARIAMGKKVAVEDEDTMNLAG